MNLFRQRPSVQDSLQRTYNDAYQASVNAILLETRNEPRQALGAWNDTLREINKSLSEMSMAPRTASEKSLMESIRDIERQCHDRISFLEYRKYHKGPYLDMPTSPGSHSSTDLASTASNINQPNPITTGYGASSASFGMGYGLGSTGNGSGNNGYNPYARHKAPGAQEPAPGYSNQSFDRAFGDTRKSPVPPPKPPKPPPHILLARKQVQKNSFDDLFKNFEGTFEHSDLDLYNPSTSEPIATRSQSVPQTSFPHAPAADSVSPPVAHSVSPTSQPQFFQTPISQQASIAHSTSPLSQPPKPAPKPKGPNMPKAPPPPPPPRQPKQDTSKQKKTEHPSQTQPVLTVSASSSPGSSRESLESVKPKSHSTSSIGDHAKSAPKHAQPSQQQYQQYSMLRTLRTAKPGKISNGTKQPAANKAATLAWGDRGKNAQQAPKRSFEVVRNAPAKSSGQSTSPGTLTPRPKLTSAHSTPTASTPNAAKAHSSATAAQQATRPSTVYLASSVRKGSTPTTASKKPPTTTTTTAKKPAAKQKSTPKEQKPTKVHEKLVPAGVEEETKESSSEEDSKNMSEMDKKAKKVLKELKGVDENAAKQILNEIVVRGDEVHWDDIAGLEQAKSSLKEAVVYPFLRPDLFSGLREPARGMLLFGPPGTGKTMLARAVATESNSTFFSISASSLTSKFLGESEKLVRALFYMAKKFAPSIIFVDEIDSLLSTRSEAGEHEASRRIKNEFLVQWSDLQSAAAGRERDDIQRVLVLAATNLPWGIDEAARRRFVRRQYIPLPERETRKYQLTKLLSHQKHALSEAEIEKLLDLTDGFSGSDITALAKDAAMGPLRSLGEALLTTPREQIRPIQLEDFERSLLVIRPSVSKEGLQAFENWAKEFGSSGA